MQIGAAVGEMGLADGFESRSSRHMCIEVPLLREVFLKDFRISTLLRNNTTELQFSSQRTQVQP